ncbi:YceH family protein [Pedobacter sp. SYP-B3415]|uniref:YceH family protein n=1 Tax=Pedobacter sp. SYP-B3415 TaxID=2496641 RepID=UPI00101B6A6C|nr:YceH family protein [Pedobacter sp. SYP-B3415]
MDYSENLPQLSAEEIRVLGSLMEKAKTTPDYYPMTINSLTAACNQKTSRKPVVNYDEQTVTLTLDTLKRKGLISTATGGSSRAVKFKHNFAIVFPLLPAEVALISLLFLRGPQTPGELNTNAGRMHEFENLDEVTAMLEKLSQDQPAYVKALPRRPGQKEQRYVHLFGEQSMEDFDLPDEDLKPAASGALEARVTELENELAALKEKLDALYSQLM